MIARLPGPGPEGHFRFVFEGYDVILPGWNHPQIVDKLIASWENTSRVRVSRGTPPYGQVLATQGQPFTGGQLRVLASSAYPAFAAHEGAILAMANSFDHAALGIDVKHVGHDAIEEFQIHVSTEAVSVSLGLYRQVLLQRLHSPVTQIRTAMRSLATTHALDQQAIRRGLEWSPFAARVATGLTPDARGALEAEMNAYRDSLLRGEPEATMSFKRMVPVQGVEHASKASFRVTRRMAVQATLHFDRFTLSERSIAVKGQMPESFTSGLVGRTAETVVDHELVRGRIIEAVFQTGDVFVVGLAA